MQPAAFRTGHVGLNVTDLPRAKRFYTEVFGLEVVGESADPGKPFDVFTPATGGVRGRVPASTRAGRGGARAGGEGVL